MSLKPGQPGYQPKTVHGTPNRYYVETGPEAASDGVSDVKREHRSDFINPAEEDYTELYDTETLQPRKDIILPDYYQSMMSVEEKLETAYAVSDIVRERTGLTPVTASVTGSRLRGVDRATSDTDVLVLVEEKFPFNKALQMDFPELDDVEGAVQSVSEYSGLISKSVPYLEFLRSPFRITDPRYTPYMDSLRINETEWKAHSQRFIRHLFQRKNSAPEKVLRNASCVWYVSKTGSPLCPRSLSRPDTTPQEAIDWIKDSYAHPDADPKALERVLNAVGRN